MNCKSRTKTIRIFVNGLLLLAAVELYAVTGTLADPVSPSQVAAAVEAAVSSATAATTAGQLDTNNDSDDHGDASTPAAADDKSPKGNDDKQQQHLLLAPLVMTQNGGDVLPLRTGGDSAGSPARDDAAGPSSRPSSPVATPHRGPAVIVEIIAAPSESEQHIEVMAGDTSFIDPGAGGIGGDVGGNAQPQQQQNYLINDMSSSSNYLYYPVQQQQQDRLQRQPSVNYSVESAPVSIDQQITEQPDRKQQPPHSDAVQPQQQPVVDNRVNAVPTAQSPSYLEPLLSLQQYHLNNDNNADDEKNQSAENQQPMAQGQLQLMLQREQQMPQQQQQQQQYQPVQVQPESEAQQPQFQLLQQQQYQPVQAQQQPQPQQPQQYTAATAPQQNDFRGEQYGNQQQQQQQQHGMLTAAASSPAHAQYYYKYPPPPPQQFQHPVGGFRNNNNPMMAYRKRTTRQHPLQQHQQQQQQQYPLSSKDNYADGTAVVVQSENSISGAQEDAGGKVLAKHQHYRVGGGMPPFRPSHPLWASQYPVPWLYYVRSTLEIPKSVQQYQPYGRNSAAGVPSPPSSYNSRKSRTYHQSKRPQWYNPNGFRRDVADPTAAATNKKVVYIEYGGFKPKMVPSVEVRLFDNGGVGGDDTAAYEYGRTATADSQEAYDSSVNFQSYDDHHHHHNHHQSSSSTTTGPNSSPSEKQSSAVTAVPENDRLPSNVTTTTATTVAAYANQTVTTPSLPTSTTQQPLVIVV